MKAITFAIFIFAFFLLRPYQLQQTGLSYEGDDHSYFAHATSIAFMQFPSYKNEYFTVGGHMPIHSIGPGLMAAPFVFLFSLFDRLSDNDVVIKRTATNVIGSWSLFGFVVASLVYFWLSCLLLYSGLRFNIHISNRNAVLSILLMVLFQGIPLFVFRRPIFSHVYEFFLQSALVYILLKGWHQSESRSELNRPKYSVLIGLLIGLMILVRYNNIVMAAIWPLVLYGVTLSRECFAKTAKSLIITYSTSAVLLAVFVLLPILFNGSGSYGLGEYMSILSPSFYFKRFLHMLVGLDWGLAFTTPFMLIGCAAVFAVKFAQKKQLLLLLAPLLINVITIMHWKTQGGWYGYRYLMFSLIPLVIYPFACFLETASLHQKTVTYVILALLSLPPVFSMLAFEGNSTSLTLNVITQYFGISGWGNNTYQLEVWKTAIFHPVEFVTVVLKGGVVFFAYVSATMFHFTSHLPGVIIEKYKTFDLIVVLKTVIVYSLPFLLFYITHIFSSGSSSNENN